MQGKDNPAADAVIALHLLLKNWEGPTELLENDDDAKLRAESFEIAPPVDESTDYLGYSRKKLEEKLKNIFVPDQFRKYAGTLRDYYDGEEQQGNLIILFDLHVYTYLLTFLFCSHIYKFEKMPMVLWETYWKNAMKNLQTRTRQTFHSFINRNIRKHVQYVAPKSMIYVAKLMLHSYLNKRKLLN